MEHVVVSRRDSACLVLNSDGALQQLSFGWGWWRDPLRSGGMSKLEAGNLKLSGTCLDAEESNKYQPARDSVCMCFSFSRRLLVNIHQGIGEFLNLYHSTDAFE